MTASFAGFNKEICSKLAALPIWKLEASENKNSESYFVNHPTFSKVINDDSIFLIKSQKGTGKTAIKTMMKYRIERQSHGEKNPGGEQFIENGTVLDLQFSKLFNSLFFDSLQNDWSENYKVREQQHHELIKFTILIAIFSRILEKEKDDGEWFNGVDDDMCKLISSFVTIDIPSTLRKDWDLKINWEVATHFGMLEWKTGGEYKRWEKPDVSVHFTKLITPIENRLFKTLKNGRQYYFLIDKTDDFWDKYGEDYELFIAKFIQCCSEINANIRDDGDWIRAKLVIFVRTDLYNLSFKHVKGNSWKISKDQIISIDWEESYKDPNSSLIKVMEDRLRYWLLQIGEIPPDPKESVAEKLLEFKRNLIQSGDTKSLPTTSFFNFTFLHPRDVVILTYELLCNDEEHKFKKGYGEYIYNEVIKDQLSIKIDNPDAPMKIFWFLKQFLKEKHWKTEFDVNDSDFENLFTEQLSPFFKTKSLFLEKLLETSIIGTISPNEYDQTGKPDKHFAYRDGSVPKICWDTIRLIFHYWTFASIGHYSPSV